MKKFLLLIALLVIVVSSITAQVEPGAGTWKTWFITSGKTYRLAAPGPHKDEVQQVLAAQQNLTTADLRSIQYWNAGSPGYRWYSMMNKLWSVDFSGNGALANVLLNVGIYDATVAAWDTKYAYNRPRPTAASSKIVAHTMKPESPSYPCEYSVAAGVAVTIISKYYPQLADSANRMAQRLMASRIAAGTAFPSDTRAGFELGKKIAEAEIEFTKDYITKKQFDGKMPEGPGVWTGKNPMMPMAGQNKTIVLESGNQLRPAAPPDFAKEMDELRNYKQTFRSKANAFYYATQSSFDELLTKKIFENNLHFNAPRAARIHAAISIANHDAFVACWDAKYAYWGIRPEQYDPNYKPLIPTPPFPGYPSGHATLGGAGAAMMTYFFPTDKAQFDKIATDAAESRFQAGIHFRTDNEAGVTLGRSVAEKVIERFQADGVDQTSKMLTAKK